MKIIIRSIPHKLQRYETSGDYWKDKDGTIQLRVDESNFKDEMLIAIHELVELYLAEMAKIDWNKIDEFDKNLDATHPDLEPGDQNNAPYYRQHQIATLIEKMLLLEVSKK